MCMYIYVQTIVHTYVCVSVYFAFTYDDLFQQHGCISSIELSTVRNSSAFVIYIAIAGMSESTRY